ncbi:hypothetical protein [Billgrantia endophytica]|nr:hypothetical protein [Halomonas endophytica]
MAATPHYHDESSLLWLVPGLVVLAINCLPLIIGVTRAVVG